MQFKEIIGQQAVKDQLIRSAREGRVSHAQLFTGAEGNGALPLAIAYAQYLSCEQATETDSCGSCVSCKKYQKLAHPDLHFSYPFIASKKETVALDYVQQWREALLEQPYLTLEKWMQRLDAGNKQPNINIAECHSIISKLSLKPFESDFKVLIMWLPEFLREVGNSLLKLIEEPSSKTLFLLVSEQPDQLLSTLLSRTQLVRTARLGEEEIAGYLLDSGEINPELARQAARLSGGNLAAAIDLLAGESSNYGQLFMDWMRVCYQGDGLKMVEWSDNAVSAGRENQKNLLRYGLSLIRQSLLMRVGLPVQALGQELEFITRFSAQLDPEKATAISGELEKAIYHIERNANPRILFLDVSLQIMRLLKSRQVLPGSDVTIQERNYGM
ncbi:DNA polymerase-3 subunit delta' [Anseongella ginsenosidimutans]|uniref:DNA polymerase-3 subunit delta n=1 Tax=Anseongella ginsenosidimutans TaxID=496056 RepID=A0A4R3KQB4_9SPHI|nr:DNA polymerase III subunit delta' [Anseongella ginsenosidimutans]QEC52063.1 hypothetical protein FRZ59_06785 [Anseongella ginsenosidimutans]TCS85625.1 DNA polymerase-3 subunit delta' [Anseongella ginsenosidimutans]